jgi:hypothetical protein
MVCGTIAELETAARGVGAEYSAECSDQRFRDAIPNRVGAEYSVVDVEQGFRDAILNDQALLMGLFCRSPSPISSTTPKVRRRGSGCHDRVSGTHRLAVRLGVLDLRPIRDDCHTMGEIRELLVIK